MRVEDPPGSARLLHVIRKSGEVVEVSEADVVKFKLIPGGAGPIRPPASWEENRAQS
jgi:hypothetical protein